MSESLARAHEGGAPEAQRWRAPDVGSAEGTDARGPLTAARLAAIEQQAREEGFRRGLEEGRREGEREMLDAARRIESLIEAIEPRAALLDEQLIAELGDLVVAVARQLVRRELKREPGEVVRAVREAIAALPVSDAAIRVFVHPDDAALLRRALRPDAFERPLRILDDVAMTQGGARVETDVSSVDASVEARLNAIAANVFGDERDVDVHVEVHADTERGASLGGAEAVP